MLFYHLASLFKAFLNLPAKANVTTNDEDGTAIDLVAEGQFHSGLALCQIGAATGGPSSVSVVFTLEESADNSVWTTAKDSDGANATVTITGTAASTKQIDFYPNQLKQYIRLNRVVTIAGGTSPTAPTAGTLLLGAGRKIPVV